MPNILNNLGTRLFQSVTDKAGDLGDKFEEEFSKLAQNITADIDNVVDEIAELSVYIKITLSLVSVLLVVIILRYLAFGGRVLFFKAREWLQESENRKPPQVILLMPHQDEQTPIESNMIKVPFTPSSTPPFSPEVPLRSQQKDSTAHRSLNIYADPLTFQNLENIKRNSYALFNKSQQ